MITSKYSYKLTTVNIYEVRSKFKYTQHLSSMYWWPDNTGYVCQFINLRKIETRELLVQKIFFTTQNRTDTITGICFLSLTFVLQKLYSETNLFVMIHWELWIEKNKYLWKLMPFNIHKVILQINHNKHLRSMSWRSDNANWVWQFRIQRRI